MQTKRHARICSLMGIRNFVFAVNKMDLVNYSEEVFKKIEAQIGELTAELSLGNVVIIPLSATEGDNVTKKSENIPWYHGEALLPYLEQVDVAEIQEEKGFYLPVQRVCRPNHEFRGFQGQIEAGSISVGDEITTLPSNEKAHVKSIHVGDKKVESAGKGRPVTIQLDREVDVSRGCVLTNGSDIKIGSSIITTLLWMDDAPLENGKNYFVKLGSKLIPGVVTEILHSIDVNSGEEKTADHLNKNEIAVAKVTFAEPIVVDEFKKHKTLGELILIDRVSNMTSACGVVTEVVEESKGTENSTVDVNVRAALKGQLPVAVEFPVETDDVTVALIEKVEKILSNEGRHTYLFAPEQEKNEVTAQVVKHLLAAGVIVLLAGKAEDLGLLSKEVISYQEWKAAGEQAEEIAEYIKKKTAYSIQEAKDRDYI